MIMIVKTPVSQMGSRAAAGGGEAMRGGRGESAERSEVQARSTLTSTAPKVRSRSREVVTRDETPRISLRVSSKLPTLASSSLSSVITALASSRLPAASEAGARHPNSPHMMSQEACRPGPDVATPRAVASPCTISRSRRFSLFERLPL